MTSFGGLGSVQRIRLIPLQENLRLRRDLEHSRAMLSRQGLRQESANAAKFEGCQLARSNS